MSSAAQPQAYPGNLSLPVEVREKILSTFRHTLDLYRDGKLDDCLIGCDFILKMDPRFAPARRLQEKARNPKADVDMAELEAAVSPTSPPAAPSGARETGGAPVGIDAPRATPVPSGRETMETAAEDAASGAGALGDLSLDALSLDGPLPDLSTSPEAEAGLPFEPARESSSFESPFAEPGYEPPAVADLAAFEAPDPEHQIAALVRQGEDAKAAGDPQQAIEIWSRIFLIDINHAEAAARIEKTREEMAAQSRAASAAAALVTDAASTPARATSGTPQDATTLPPSPHDLSAVATPVDVLADEMDQSGPPGGRRSWSVPRPPRESASAIEIPAAEAEGAKRLPFGLTPRIAMIAGVAVVAVLLGAVFLLTRSSGQPPAGAAVEAGPSLERATSLFREGKIAETAEELKRIPADHPDYAQAQKLLASLAAPGDAPAPDAAGAAAPGPPAAASAGSDAAGLRAEAEKALAEKRYIDALKSFSLAAPHFPADPAFSQKMAEASEKVSELTPAVKLYNDAEYDTAIPILWRIYQASRDNQDARSYLLRSYYNQGIGQIQNGLNERAIESFGEVLALDPQDVEAARHRRFAERYRGRDLDLLGRIYLRYISPRP